MSVAVAVTDPCEVAIVSPHRRFERLNPMLVSLLEKSRHALTRLGVIDVKPHVILVAVDLGDGDLSRVRAPANVSEIPVDWRLGVKVDRTSALDRKSVV